MKPRNDSGFSAIEVVLVLAMLGTATLSMAHSILSDQQTLSYIEEDTRLMEQAQTLMSRLTQIPFGTGAESSPTSTALTMLCAPENNLFGSSSGSTCGWHGTGSLTQTFTGATVTLTQVRMRSPLRWEYAVNGNEYYGRGGIWEVIVSRDLNGDGDTSDPMETATASTDDLYRIEVRHDGRKLLRTIRSRNPVE